MAEIDSQIIQKSRDGDKGNFRVIVLHYQRMIFSLALKLLCDEEDAKDLVQDTFIKVWLNLKQYDSRQNFTTWIYTIAVRLCLDKIKRHRNMVVLPEDSQVFQHYVMELDIQKELENHEWIAIVRKITEGMSEKQRVVFTLCQLEGLTSSEVEQITGMNVGQVKSNLYIARQTVKEHLKKIGYE